MTETVFASVDPVSVNPLIEVLAVQTPTLPPATHTNTFIVGSGEAVFIEPASPYPEEIERMVAWIAGAERQGKKVQALLLTHHHPDHAGGAQIVKQRTGKPLWAHEKTAQFLSGHVEIDRLLRDDEVIQLQGPTACSLRAIHTPGHAAGHLCFLQEETGAMIAGDMVASVGTIIIDPDEGEGDMSDYLASLRKMKALRPTSLLPAHGEPIVDPASKIDGYVAHRAMREERVLAALAKHSQAAALQDLLPDAYADTPRMLWPLAERSLLAHLKKLVKEGRVQEHNAQWKLINER